MSGSELPSARIRLRLGQEDAHYGGNLVAGATQLKIVGDLITELAMRYDGDEGLFRAYESIPGTRRAAASSRSGRSALRARTSPGAQRSSSTNRS